MRNKRGELTTQQIIMLIILIVSFIVILFFIFRLQLGKESDAELCHNSVVLRGSSEVPADSVPLKCSRSYVCITSGGGCEKLTNPEKKKVETKDEIYQVLADEMANCWWMFGEGEYDYIGDTVVKQNYCSICSQILFDDSLEEKFGNLISKDEFYEYLEANEIEEGKTYLEYFFGTRSLENLKQGIINNERNSEGVGTFGTIEVGEQYFVVMGIRSEIGNIYKWIGGGVAVAGVVLGVTTGLGFIGGAIIVGAGAGTGFFGDDVAGLIEPEIGAILVEGNGVDNKFMAPTIIKANSEKFDALNCGEVITLS